MSPENLPLEEPQPQGMNAIQRLTGVFFEPKKTFADIAGRPTWVVPLILAMVASLVFIIMIGQRVGWERVVRQSLEQRMTTMTQQQRDAVEKSMDLQVKITSVSAYLAPIVVPIGFLVVAGVLTGIASGIMSAGIRFKQMLAIVAWSWIPGLVSTALSLVVLFVKSPDEFNMQNPIGFNPGAYMDPLHSSKFIYSLAGSLDLFVIWMMLLMAVGIKEASERKLGFGGALAAVLVPWGVIVLGKASLAGIF